MRFLYFLSIFLLLLVPTASALDNFTDGAGNYNTAKINEGNGMTYHEYIQRGGGTQFAYSGNVTNVIFAIPDDPTINVTSINTFKIKIWRFNGDDYTCVGVSEELEDELVAGMNNLTLDTELEVQVGDYYGFALSNTITASACFDYSSDTDFALPQTMYYAGAEVFTVGDRYDFVNDGTYFGNKVFRIGFQGYRHPVITPMVDNVGEVNNQYSTGRPLGQYIVPMNKELSFNVSVPSGTTNVSLSIDDVVKDYETSPSSTETLTTTIATFGKHSLSICYDGAVRYTNMTIYAVEGAQSAPYAGYSNEHHDSGTITGLSTYYLQQGHTTRIRQNGNVSAIGLYTYDNTNLSVFRFFVWRYNSTSTEYYKIGESTNLCSYFTDEGYNLIELPTPIAVQEGDYYGWACKNPSGTFYRYADDDGDRIKYVSGDPAAGTLADSYDWDSKSTILNTTFRIDVYMDEFPDIVLIGDSHISGYGAPNAHLSFADSIGTSTNIPHQIGYQLSNLTGYTYQNMGICGQKSNSIQDRFREDVLYANPTYVLIEGGFNDYKTNRTQDETIADWDTMIEAAQELDIQPIAFEILGTNDYSKGGDVSNMTERDYINKYLETTYGQTIPVVHGRNYVGIYDSNGTTGNLWGIHSDYVSTDGYHYNIDGYTKLAQAVKDEMNESLGANPSNMNYGLAVGGLVTVSFAVVSFWNRRRSR